MAQVKQIDQNQDNNQQNEQQQAQPQTLAGSTQSGSNQPSSGRIASFSSGSQPQASGRFTNLQKYMDANKSASTNMGAKANQVVNKDFSRAQSDVSKQNEQIAQGFQQGRQALQQGQGFQKNLQDINTGLNTGYTDFGNRQGFDTAAEQAQQLAQNQDYSRVASGQGFDQSSVGQQQQQALLASQGLLQNTQNRLSGLQTEQGRDELFSQVLQPKQGYTSGQRNFDKLFLGGSLPSLQQNLQGKSTLANQILQGTQGQQSTLDELTSGEENLLKGLTNQATTNQQTFYNKLYNPENIDFVKNARTTEFDNLVKALTSGGSITQDQAKLLGLSAQNSSGVSSGPISSKVGVEGISGEISTPQSYDVRTLNVLKDPANITKYLQRGGDPQSLQDIVMQDDLNNYNALTGLIYNNGKQATQNQLTGTSTMGSIFQPGSSGETLGQAVANANKQFNQDVANNKFGINQTQGIGRYSVSSQAAADNIQKLAKQTGLSVDQILKATPNNYYFGDQNAKKVVDAILANRGDYQNVTSTYGDSSWQNPGSIHGDAETSIPLNVANAIINSGKLMRDAGAYNDISVSQNPTEDKNKRFRKLL